MLDFIISNYMIFMVIAIVLLLGLFGYLMDRKKYEEYRQELINEDRANNLLEAEPDIPSVVSPSQVQNEETQETIS